MHSKSGNIEMIKDEADKVIEELFKYLQNRYQNNLKELTKGRFCLWLCLFIS